MDEDEVEATTCDESMETSVRKSRPRKQFLYSKIVRQMEFYFGDANLSRDRFLSKLLEEDKYVSLEVFMTFNKIKSLTTDINDLIKALRNSEMLKVTDDGTKVYRVTELQKKENMDDCTIYVEQLPSDVSHEWVEGIFSAYGAVDYISIPKYKRRQAIKGFAFVEYASPESAQKALEAFGSVGCCLPSQMPPEELCSIATFEEEQEEEGDELELADGETLKQKKLSVDSGEEKDADASMGKKKKHKQKLAELGAEDSQLRERQEEEAVENITQATKKKKKKRSAEAEEETQEETEKTKKKKKHSTEAQDQVEEEPEKTKKKKMHSAEADEQTQEEAEKTKRKKKKQQQAAGDSDTSEKEESWDAQRRDKRAAEEPVGTEGPSKRRKLGAETEPGSEAEAEDPEQGSGNRPAEEPGSEAPPRKKHNRKRNKNKKREKKEEDPLSMGLRILSKAEWRRLRNKYLNMQRAQMHALKQHLARAQWGGSGDGGAADPPAQPQPPRLAFCPGVIVRVALPAPVQDLLALKREWLGAQGEARVQPDVRYVDMQEGVSEMFLRCASAEGAQKLVASQHWEDMAVLAGEAEAAYWDKIHRDREQKRSAQQTVGKQRGRDKLLKRAERELGKHIRFDD